MLAEDKYRYKEINPFKYVSRESYKRNSTNVEFWLIIAFLIVVICISAIFILVAFILPKDNSLALISAFILTFLFFALFGFVAWLSVESYGVGYFIDECKERYKMRKYPNYIPIEYSAITELNSIVKMQSGELFRKYQFINAEKSGTNYITLQVPKNIIFDTYKVKGTPSAEKMCMFNRLSEMELMDILIPIKQYYEDKQYREEMERKETEIKAQSEANSRIKTEDIHNLPLFKSMQSLADKTEEDIKKYHKETQSHLKDNQDIVDKVKETIKDKK